MATTKTGFLRFLDPNGEVVERPQEEIQSLRRAGFRAEAGQSLLFADGEKVQRVPIENITRIPASASLAIPSAANAFKLVANEEYGGLGGVAKGLAYGAGQGFTSGFGAYGAQKAGLVGGETLAMIDEAQPVAKFVGEGIGMAAQGGVLGVLGKAARGAGAVAKGVEAAGAVAEGAEAVGAASKGASLASRLGKGAASMGLYGAGSELTEAQIEGREANPLKAAAVMGALGAAGEVAAPYVSKALGKGKEFFTKVRADKLAEDIEGSLADAAKQTAAARTPEEVAAAKVASDKARAQAKAGGVAYEKNVKKYTDDAVDQADINAGAGAAEAIDAQRVVFKNDLEARATAINTAVANINTAKETLAGMGFAGKTAVAAAEKLQQNLGNVAEKLAITTEDIATNEGRLAAAQRERAGKTTLLKEQVKNAGLKEQNAQAVAKAAAEVTRVRAANAGEAAIQKAEQSLANVRAEGAFREVASQNANEILAASVGQTEVLAAQNKIAKAVGKVGGAIDREMASLEKLDSQSRRVLGEEMIKTGESGAAADTVIDALGASGAKEAENIANVFVQKTTGLTPTGFPHATKRTITQALDMVAKQGFDKFMAFADAMPRAVSIGNEVVASKPGHLFDWLMKNDAFIKSLDVEQRVAIGRMVNKGEYAATTAKAREEIARRLRSKAKPVALKEVAADAVVRMEGSAAASTEARAAEAMTPEMAYTAKDQQTLDYLAGERALGESNRKQLSALENSLKDVESEVARNLKRAEDRLAAATEKQSTAKTTQARIEQNLKINQTNADIARQKSAADSIAVAQKTLAEARVAAAAGGSAAADAAKEASLDATRAAQEATLAGRILKGDVKRASLETAERGLKEKLKILLGEGDKGGIRELEQSAAAIIDLTNKDFAGAIEQHALTKKYFVAGEEEIVAARMKDFANTPEGKKFYEQVTKAAQAERRKAVRQVATEAEAKARGGVAEAAEETGAPVSKQEVIDMMTSPAVVGSMAAGGPIPALMALISMVASRGGKGSVRKALVSMSPMFFYDASVKTASFLEAVATSKVLQTARTVATQRVYAKVTRPEVEAAKTYVDDLLKDQEDARSAFMQAASSITIPDGKFKELEAQYMGVVSELQKRRPMTYGKGAPSAGEEDFVKAVRVMTSPMSITDAIRSGTLTQSQADMLKVVSPAAYANMRNMVETVARAQPKAVSPYVVRSFRIASEVIPGRLSVGAAQSLMSQATQAQQEQQQSQSLGTRNPAKKSSIAENASLDRSRD